MSRKQQTLWGLMEDLRSFYAVEAQNGNAIPYNQMRVDIQNEVENLVPQTGRGVAKFIHTLGERFATKFVYAELKIQPAFTRPATIRDAVAQVAVGWILHDVAEWSMEEYDA